MSACTEQLSGTVTVRLIRSFEHRNIKHIVFTNVDFQITTQDFITVVDNDIKVRPGLPPPFRKYKYDTLKISHQPHGAKTSDPVINKEDDNKLILIPDKLLKESGVVNETELSYFNMEDYIKYKADPHLAW